MLGTNTLVDHLRKLGIDDKKCVGDTRTKWISLPGPHHPGFFQNVSLKADPNKIFTEEIPPQWKQYTSPRDPIDPFRIWVQDRRGFRKTDYYNALTDCTEDLKNRSAYKSYYTEKRHSLIDLQYSLLDFQAHHPADLLNDFVYRKPDYYLKHFAQTKKDCKNGTIPPYIPVPTKKMSKRCIHRSQFMTRNYNSIDDGYP